MKTVDVRGKPVRRLHGVLKGHSTNPIGPLEG
jgi:hypothetical protein